MTAFIEQLVIYPVKGLAGIAVDSAQITPFGLAGDRRYMLVDENGRFLTQRTLPQLTQFSVGMPSPEKVIIEWPDGDVVWLPMLSEDALERFPERKLVEVWGDEVEAATGWAEVDAFFSDALEKRVQLAWMPEDARRVADPDFTAHEELVSFADGFPILVLGSASIDELNQRLRDPVPMNRFRANVLVGGSEPWEEDTWKNMQVGDASVDLVKPCARCVVITTDQATGERSKEPTAALATYRRRDGKVMVGMNAVAHPHGATLRVGAHIQVK